MGYLEKVKLGLYLPLRTFADLCMTYRFVSRVMKHASSLVFLILQVVVLEKTLDICTWNKQSVRIASVQIHSFGSCIYLVHFNVCRKTGLAEPKGLKLGCSK